ncbi:MAG: sulfite exporter TauE/SafE family protein [Blastocatellia bacterium]
MDTLTEAALTLLIFLAAMLYASVGHAGASGYLAAMALFGIAPAVMKPSALTLNLLVGAIAAWKFHRAGQFRFSLFWPFALTSSPCAFIGGLVTIPGSWYRKIVGAVLVYSAWRLIQSAKFRDDGELTAPAVWLALLCGAGLGFLSGLTGVGGGIFLSPLLLFAGWANTRHTAGVSAMFIWVNSLAGLLGQWFQQGPAVFRALPRDIMFWAAAAIIGGWLGAAYGSRHLASVRLRQLLGVVLIIAAVKFIFS